MTPGRDFPPGTRVLVLLAAYNGTACIERQIASVLAQRDVEVLIDVRDDGSKDGTRELVASLAAQDARLRLRPDHRGTGSAAGNFFELLFGADLAAADFVAFCDQDDEWHAGKLARAVACLREQGASGYSCGVEAAWPDGRRRRLVQDPRTRGADHLFEGAGQGCTFVMSSAFVARARGLLQARRELLSRVHYHDWTLYALARTLGERWVIDPQVHMTYLQHGGNDTGARGSADGVRRRLALIASGWYRRQVDAIAELVCSVRPDDPAATRWRALSAGGWRRRWQRLHFVATAGRRRRVDRMVLVGAVLLGYL